jgi:hypothetical protein
LLDTPLNLTQTYFVPDYACGKIIGKGGANIKEISIATNCRLKLNDKIYNENIDNNNNNNCNQEIDNLFQGSYAKKMLTFTGSSEQIAQAKKLIVQKIKEEEAFMLRRQSRDKLKSYSQQNLKNSSTYSLSTFNEQTITKQEYDLKPTNLVDLRSYLDANNCVDIFVSAICNPFTFWVQIVNSFKLEDLLNDMNNYYNNKNDQEKALFVSVFIIILPNF